MAALKRTGLVIIAYLLAAVATAVVVAALHFILPGPSERIQGDGVVAFFALSWTIFIMVSFLALAFALWVIALGEWLMIRNVFYYAIAGALIGLLLGSVMREQPWFPYAGVVQGLVAGAIYWRIAGKTSGMLERRFWFLAGLAGTALVASFWIFPLFVGILGLPRFVG